MKIDRFIQDDYILIEYSESTSFQEALSAALGSGDNLLFGGHFCQDLPDGTHTINLFAVNCFDDSSSVGDFDGWMSMIQSKYLAD